MRHRRFGRTGWNVSEIGYGMWGMGGWTGSDDEESARALDRAIALGCSFFDTAWVYGNGRSEKLLGAALKSHSGAKLIVATKVPPKNMRWPAPAGVPTSRARSVASSSLRPVKSAVGRGSSRGTGWPAVR